MRKFAFISAVLMFLLSCQPEHIASVDRLPDASDARKVNVTINLSGADAHTKAATVGTEKITNIAVIVRPDYSDISKSWSKALVSEFDDSHIDNGVFSGAVTAYVGRNIFYVIVNYTPEMLSFIRGTGIGSGKGLRESRESAFSPSLSANGFGPMQEELISSFKDSDRGVTMMTKCDGGPSTLIPESDALSLTGTLHRMVAKVKMSFETYKDAQDFVKVEGFVDKHHSEIPNQIYINGINDNNGSQAGWVPLNSIRYCLNAVNTKVFLEASDSCDNRSLFPYDPNFSLDKTIVADGADWNYAPGYENDFIFWDPNDAATLFNNNPGTSSWMVNPPNEIYCLENTVSSTDFLSEFDLSSSYRRIAPRRATTHLLIECKFTPRYIITGRQPAGLRDPIYEGFHDLADAIAILKDNEHLSEPGDGTFWTPDLKHFYNWAGVQAEIAYSVYQHGVDPSYHQLTVDDFVKYPQGKCYYTAYISGEAATDPDTQRTYLTYSDGLSSVRRDASYTLNATVLHVPSISMSMMEINTTGSLEWPDRDGSGEINIKPQ